MEIEKAFKKLLIKNPFYGLFCLNLPKNITRSVDTLSVRQKGTTCELCVNPDFWEQFSEDQCIALLTHELSHIALKHIFMSSSFADHKLFNIAADAEVNSYIDNLPEGSIDKDWIRKKTGENVEEGMGTKKYYEILQKYLNQQGNQNNPDTQKQSKPKEDKKEENNPPPSSAQEEQNHEEEETQDDSNKKESSYSEEFSDLTPYDSHEDWKDFCNIPEPAKQLISNNIDSALKATAEQVEKAQGHIPSNLVEAIEKLKKPKPRIFDWKTYFRRMMGTIYDINIRSTRRKPSKRFKDNAGIVHRKKVSILVAIDTSGSVNEKEFQEFFSEMNYIYKAGARITIMQCDTRITSITDYDGKNVPTIQGRGGTSFYPPIKYYMEHKKEYSALVYFTDGYASIPPLNPRDVIWVITSNGLHQDYPGKTLYIPQKQEN